MKLGIVGAVTGLAWAAGFRSYMRQISGTPHIDWAGTFAGILLPGLLVGLLLGVAESRRRAGRVHGLRWFALAPLAFAVAPMLFPGALVTFLTTGQGGGAVGVALFAIVGGFALGGGPLWARITTGVIAGALLAGVILTVPLVGGHPLSTARGAWVAVLVAAFLVLLALASSIPFGGRRSSSRVRSSAR